MAIFQPTISGGGTQPTGTKYITTNGVHDVTDYASADVQVPTTAPAHYIQRNVDANGKLITTGAMPVIDFTGITDFGDQVLQYSYYNNTTISGTIDMSSVTKITGTQACVNTFFSCTGITGVNLSSLTIINSYASLSSTFSYSGVISADLSSLTTISGYSACNGTFQNCYSLDSVNISSLTTVSGTNACTSMFSNCRSLTNIVFDSLTIISGSNAFQYVFSSCINLVISFPSLTSFGGVYTNQFNGILNNASGCIIHFPSNLDPQGGSTVISSLTGYPNFGGTNTTLLFDLPATNTLTGADTVTYTRNPKYDTGTALAWKVGAYGTTDFTPAYYTSGLTDPTVGTTIYSDSACTTAVTTISSIA